MDQNQRYFVIDELELENMMKAAARIGAVTALEKWDEEKGKQERQFAERRLHNTALLMKNYRALKAHASGSIFEASQLEESAVDILINMMSLKDDHMIVDSIKKSATRTAIMLTHIDAMLELYRQWCENSSNELDHRRYDTLYWLYVADPELTVEELAQGYHVSKESIYKDKNSAIRTLSMLLFGIDALK